MSSFITNRAGYRQLRTSAEKLRSQGLSYKEIRQKVAVSKSTLSLWCKDIKLTKKQLAVLGARYDSQLRGAKANQKKGDERKQKARQQALGEFANISQDMVKVAGAMLYWAEGSKTSGTSITNSDPVLVVFFVKWLNVVLGIGPTQLTAHLHLHAGQKEKVEKLFWSKLSGIPLKSFYKTFYKPVGTGHRKNILYHGTIRIRVNGIGSELLRHRILGLAEAVARKLVPQVIFDIKYHSYMGR